MIAPELRAKILELSRPDVPMPDINIWMERARALEAYVCGDGQPGTPVHRQAAMQVSSSPDTSHAPKAKRTRRPREVSPTGA